MLNTRYNDEITKLTRHDTEKQAIKWIEKNQKKYEKTLHVGTDIKDGFVVYQYRK